MTAPASFQCPNCRHIVTVADGTCAGCRMRLTGPTAERLWDALRQIAVLQQQSASLISQLLAPDTTPVATTTEPAETVAGDVPVRRGVSGQQLLLGLGAALVLSAASLLALVLWLVVGPAGQAAILLAGTGAAAAGSAWATRRGLRAAAETAAVLATGLVVLDLAGARALDLAGLGSTTAAWYWTVAGLVGAGLLAGFDRLVPATADRSRTYLPAAGTLTALSGWSALAALEPAGAALVCAFAVLSVSCAAGALVVWPRRPARPFGWPLAVSAAAAAAGFTAAGLVVGYQPTGAEKWVAFALLAAAVTGLGTLTGRAGAAVGFSGRDRRRLAPLAVAAAVPVAGMVVVDLHAAVIAGLALTVAAGSVWLTTVAAGVWRRPVAVLLAAVGPALFLVLWAMAEHGSSSPRGLLDAQGRDISSWTVLVAGVGWACSAALVGWSRRIALPAVSAAVAVPLTWWSAVSVFDLSDLTVVVTGVALVWMALATAALAAYRSGGDRSLWGPLEVALLGVAVLAAVGALAAATSLPVGVIAATFVVSGVAVLGYAGMPRRLAAAYPGSLLVSCGVWIRLSADLVATPEAYTAPLVALLAGVGFVHWRRNRQTASVLTMGPALSVAFGPSLAAAVVDGDETRLVMVAVAAVAVLGSGLWRGLRAPVSTGAVVLGVLALTQGGPVASLLPSWLVLGLGGLLLLGAGVAWERAILAGRATATWWSALR